MRLVVENAIQEKYPQLRIGVIVAEHIDNFCYTSELESYCSTIFTSFASRYPNVKDLEAHKNIIAWRDIYRSFGTNPKKKTPTAEALLSRVVRSRFVPHINPVVDSYLLAETLHCLPIGGYDLAKIEGDIVLRFAFAGDTFIGIGGQEMESIDAGEVIYVDTARVLTRRWNYKDCDYCKISDSTEKVALFVEAPIETITDCELQETLKAIADNLSRFCGASTRIALFSVAADNMPFAI